MLRCLSFLPPLRLVRDRYTTPVCLRLFSFRPDITDGPTEKQQIAARDWLAGFGPHTIPKRFYEITYSRSSGPGGQNVNKVSTKATVRVQLDKLLPVVPDILHEHLKASRYYAARSNTLVIQADNSRKQAGNVEHCKSKLYELLLSAGKSVVRAEVSPEQIAKWKSQYVIALLAL
ncbi:Peptide chain release factor class I/class II [Lasallia pustulata]|uniref:Peptide chain release factor class I/class II n=1 Tax=Lasallia pustulata TaxID=136370 RepID=A0A1W5DDF4_9LECA|nr:Peptide chain release factor class I/class II [Lasallia pustulata]